MSKKITKKQMFEQIMSHVTDPAEREFLMREIELLENKRNSSSARKPSKEQEINNQVREAILDFLQEIGRPMSIPEMIQVIPACEGRTSASMSGLLSPLKRAGMVVRTEQKGVAHFEFVKREGD